VPSNSGGPGKTQRNVAPAEPARRWHVLRNRFNKTLSESRVQRRHQQPGIFAGFGPDPQRIHPSAHALTSGRYPIVGEAIPWRKDDHFDMGKETADRLRKFLRRYLAQCDIAYRRLPNPQCFGNPGCNEGCRRFDVLRCGLSHLHVGLAKMFIFGDAQLEIPPAIASVGRQQEQVPCALVPSTAANHCALCGLLSNALAVGEKFAHADSSKRVLLADAG
jgi:hypothetical protein